MVLGGALAVSGHLGADALYASIPVGLLVTAILHANNVRDLEADRESGVRTVAIALGRPASLIYFLLLVYGAYLSVLALVLVRILPWSSLLVLATIPLAYKGSRALAAAESLDARRRAPLVESTAQLHLAFGLALIAGTALGLSWPWLP
jgi:1,4-dihydroxy-2-naphthoate octaprenyltransferase